MSTAQSRPAVVTMLVILAGGVAMPCLRPVCGQEIAYEDVVARLKSPDAKVRIDVLARDRDRSVAAAAVRSQKRLTVRQPGAPRTP